MVPDFQPILQQLRSLSKACSGRMITTVNESRILLVADEIKTCQIFSRFLSSRGFLVETALDGAKALVKADEFKPHCVLLDARMSRGGPTLVVRVRKQLPDAVIIVMSPVIAPGHVEDYLSKGAHVCIEKPVDFSVLLNTMGDCGIR